MPYLSINAALFNRFPSVGYRKFDLSIWCGKMFLKVHNTFSSVPTPAINNDRSLKPTDVANMSDGL